MKKKSRIIIITLFLFGVLSMMYTTFGSEMLQKSVSFQIEENRKELKVGDTVEVTMRFAMPTKLSSEINTYKAKIEYDKEIFQEVTEKDFRNCNEWEQLQYNKKTGEWIAICKKGVSESQDVVKIKLTCKKQKEVTINTKVIFSEINSASWKENQIKRINTENGKEEIECFVSILPKEDKNTNINEESNMQNTVTNNIGENIQNSIEQNQVVNNENENVKNEFVSDSKAELEQENKILGKLPQLGKNKTELILVMIVIVIVCLIWRRKKLKKKFPQIFSCFLIGIMITSVLGQTYAIEDKDKEIIALEKHLLQIEWMEEQLADIDKNGKIDLIDLALLVKSIQLEEQGKQYDKYNMSNQSYWRQVPIVSKELLSNQVVTIGGEGCQWPLGLTIDEKEGNLILYGTDVGGVYRSEDGGKTYSQSNRGLNARGVSCLAIDPNNKKRVLAIGLQSTKYGGIYLSEEEGKSWSQVKSLPIRGNRDVRESVCFDATSYEEETQRTNIAYWSTPYLCDKEETKLTEETKGLYRTLDGGYTWAKIQSDYNDAIVKVDPTNGDVYLANYQGLFRSKDHGETFDVLINGLQNDYSTPKVTGLDIIQINETVSSIYICDETGIYVSQDHGENFTAKQSETYPKKKTNSLKVSKVNPNHMIIVEHAGDYKNNNYYSVNGGESWEKSKYDKSLDMMPYNNRTSVPIWDTKNENKVWSFGGDYITSSQDAGKTFHWDSNGITGILCGGKFNFNVYNPDLLFFGSQDYNGVLTTDGGNTWKYINMSQLGWGGFCYGGYAVDENTYFVGVANGWYEPRRLKVTFDGGKTIIDTGKYFNTTIPSGAESSYQSPTNEKVLFACDLRSDDSGKTWEVMEGCINVYAHSLRGEKELYGMDETARYVVKSYDDGQTWQKCNKVALESGITDISYDSIHNIIYVAVGNDTLCSIDSKGNIQYIISKKYRDIVSHNIEGRICIKKVTVDPNDPNIIYCGGAGNYYLNDCGIYRSVDGGKSFQVITSSANKDCIIEKNSIQSGYEPVSLQVHPKTGELWSAGGCFGISKFMPPYKK